MKSRHALLPYVKSAGAGGGLRSGETLVDARHRIQRDRLPAPGRGFSGRRPAWTGMSVRVRWVIADGYYLYRQK